MRSRVKSGQGWVAQVRGIFIRQGVTSVRCIFDSRDLSFAVMTFHVLQRGVKRERRLDEERKARAEEAARLLDSGAGVDSAEMEEARKRATERLKIRQEEEFERVGREGQSEGEEGGGVEDIERRQTDEKNRPEIEQRAREVRRMPYTHRFVLFLSRDEEQDMKRSMIIPFVSNTGRLSF